MNFMSKYLGLLKDYDFRGYLFGENNLDYLLEKKVIVSINELDENRPCAYWSFGEKECYTLTYDFLEDIYNTIKVYVESLDNDSVFWFVNDKSENYKLIDIKNSTEATLNIEEKIIILKEIYKEINGEGLEFNLDQLDARKQEYKNKLNIRDVDDFSVRRLYNYFLEKNNHSIKIWKEWVFERFLSDDKLKKYLLFKDEEFDVCEFLSLEIETKTENFLGEFLKNTKSLFQDVEIYSNEPYYDLVHIWSNFISIQKINNFCISKIEELESEIGSTQKTTTINTTLYNSTKLKKTNPPPVLPDSLESIFDGVEKLDLFIDKMKDKKLIIDNKDGSYILVVPERYLKRGFKNYFCAIGYNLTSKFYLKEKCTQVEIVNAFNTFLNTNISKSHYNNLEKENSFHKYLNETSFL